MKTRIDHDCLFHDNSDDDGFLRRSDLTVLRRRPRYVAALVAFVLSMCCNMITVLMFLRNSQSQVCTVEPQKTRFGRQPEGFWQ